MELVSVLIATYKPNMYYFEKQLVSINNQTYQNIEVVIRDDSENEDIFKKIKELSQKCITKFPLIINKNDINIGSNKTFEKLTEDGSGKFLAYCDQDDLWVLNKIEMLVKAMQETGSNFGYSTLSLIDENDKLFAKKINQVRTRIKHISGEEQWEYLIRRNSVTGCTMIVDALVAKEALPFPSKEIYIHDQWLALRAAVRGKIYFLDEPLVLYRIHSSNQVGVAKMPEVENKRDYLDKRIKMEEERLLLVLDRYKEFPYIVESVGKQMILLKARKSFVERPTLLGFIDFSKLVKIDKGLFGFEFMMAITGEKLSRRILKLLKKTKL